MNDELSGFFLTDVLREFRAQRKLAERALAQVSEKQMFQVIDPESNSIAVIVKHVGGNLRSRWTDFLTSDGEKPDRNRDGEFVVEDDTRESVLSVWTTGWNALEAAFGTLQPSNLLQRVSIRGEPTAVVQAMTRSLAHTAQHVGQIILLAKHYAGSDWQTLSIPRGRSGEFVRLPPPI